MNTSTAPLPSPSIRWPLPSDIWPLEPEGSTDTPVCATPHPTHPIKPSSTDKSRGQRPTTSQLCAPFPSDSYLLPPCIPLEGLRLLLQFLLDEEAVYLCGAPRYARSPNRVNYRIGARLHKLSTPIGAITVTVSTLRYFHLRVPITKRAKRLAPELLESLACIHANGVMSGAVAALIKTVWTLKLPSSLHATLTKRLIPILEQWRNASRERGFPNPRQSPAYLTTYAHADQETHAPDTNSGNKAAPTLAVY